MWRSAFRIAAGLLAARSRATDFWPAADSTPPTDSVAEFLSLLAVDEPSPTLSVSPAPPPRALFG